MRVRFTPRARDDVRRIVETIARDNVSAGVRVKKLIEKVAVRIGVVPKRGMLTSRADVWAVPIRRYPYTIYFAFEGDAVAIVHVRHEARQRPGRGEL
jgi:toxin ParE1/3/4